ncbi:hypothetical protein ACFX11_024765 [Malus domestica]
MIKKALFVLRQPNLQDQAPTALWINNVDKSTHPTVLQDQNPKAFEGPFITVIQDQAQKPLKIHPSTVHQDQASKALEDLFITAIQDQSSTALEDEGNFVKNMFI